MTGIIAAVVAVMGTLLGTVVAQRHQVGLASRAEAQAERALRRRELIDASSTFSSLAEDYRRAQYDRWFAVLRSSGDEAVTRTRAESFRLYVETRAAVARLRLVDDGDLGLVAAEVLSMTVEMRDAQDKPALNALGSKAEEACDGFVTRARAAIDAM
ncbi:hypothetical protein ACFYY2_07455 [Streptomyces sp. NPDC001822]|uniref:hypothetical protein n=1 Tax=Streptomyces sp. NPDC001822 TaxID=3364614 RepID=UPI0036C01D51